MKPRMRDEAKRRRDAPGQAEQIFAARGWPRRGACPSASRIVLAVKRQTPSSAARSTARPTGRRAARAGCRCGSPAPNACAASGATADTRPRPKVKLTKIDGVRQRRGGDRLSAEAARSARGRSSSSRSARAASAPSARPAAASRRILRRDDGHPSSPAARSIRVRLCRAKSWDHINTTAQLKPAVALECDPCRKMKAGARSGALSRPRRAPSQDCR